MNERWGRIEYSVILVYGEECWRNKKRQACVVNLEKVEIANIDKQFVEQLKIECKVKYDCYFA